MSCYVIWNWRNKQCFDDQNLTKIIKETVMQYKDKILKSWKVIVTNNTNIHLRWQPPDNTWMTLNTNEAVNDSQKTGCGGLIRDEKGNWIAGFAKFLSKCIPSLTQLWVALEGWNLKPLPLISNSWVKTSNTFSSLNSTKWTTTASLIFTKKKINVPML